MFFLTKNARVYFQQTQQQENQIFKFLSVGLLCVFFSMPASGRDDRLQFALKRVINSVDGRKKIAKDIKLYWGTQSHPPIRSKISLMKTNRKTSAFLKSDEAACSWVLLSAIIALQNAAREAGANGIVDIRSNYKNKIFKSKNEFECGAGAIMAGVALKGSAVVLASNGAPTKGFEKKKTSSRLEQCNENGGTMKNGDCVITLD